MLHTLKTPREIQQAIRDNEAWIKHTQVLVDHYSDTSDIKRMQRSQRRLERLRHTARILFEKQFIVIP